MTPARGKLFVRPVETPESLPGGRIVLTEATRKDLTAQQAEVIEVGKPWICRDLDCERIHFGSWHLCDVHDGDWVLLAPRCLVETDTLNLYVCAQDDVIARLEV